MIKKKAVALMGFLMILSVGLILAAENPQAKARDAAQEKAAQRYQARIMFVDQNGDGICDFARDHDNDGIPNCQDPEWSRPQDGTGYKNREGNNSSSNMFKNRKGYQGGNAWNNQSFRQNQANFGGGICDRTGPKGKAYNRSRG